MRKKACKKRGKLFDDYSGQFLNAFLTTQELAQPLDDDRISWTPKKRSRRGRKNEKSTTRRNIEWSWGTANETKRRLLSKQRPLETSFFSRYMFLCLVQFFSPFHTFCAKRCIFCLLTTDRSSEWEAHDGKKIQRNKTPAKKVEVNFIFFVSNLLNWEDRFVTIDKNQANIEWGREQITCKPMNQLIFLSFAIVRLWQNFSIIVISYQNARRRWWVARLPAVSYYHDQLTLQISCMKVMKLNIKTGKKRNLAFPLNK